MFLLKIKKGFKTEVELSKGIASAKTKKNTQVSNRFSSHLSPMNFLSHFVIIAMHLLIKLSIISRDTQQKQIMKLKKPPEVASVSAHRSGN